MQTSLTGRMAIQQTGVEGTAPTHRPSGYVVVLDHTYSPDSATKMEQGAVIRGTAVKVWSVRERHRHRPGCVRGGTVGMCRRPTSLRKLHLNARASPLSTAKETSNVRIRKMLVRGTRSAMAVLGVGMIRTATARNHALVRRSTLTGGRRYGNIRME